MSAVDPTWVSIVISLSGIIGSFFSAYLGVKIAVTRIEERQANQKEDIEDHETRIRVIERDLPPADYARR